VFSFVPLCHEAYALAKYTVIPVSFSISSCLENSLPLSYVILIHRQVSKDKVDPNKINTITFGQPAVGLWDFVSKYRPILKNFVRVVNIGNPNKIFNSV
jgi:hypothetical protein